MSAAGPSLYPPLGPDNGSNGPKFLTGWDLAVLGGNKLPGKTKLTRGGIKLKVDVKAKAGADGGTVTLHGLDPQQFDLENTTWTEEQREELYRVLRLVAPRPGGKPAIISLDHPAVRHFGFPIGVLVIGCGPLLPQGPCITKITLTLQHAQRIHNGATHTAKGAAQRQPIRNVTDLQSNPLPTDGPMSVAPPNFTPAQ